VRARANALRIASRIDASRHFTDACTFEEEEEEKKRNFYMFFESSRQMQDEFPSCAGTFRANG